MKFINNEILSKTMNEKNALVVFQGEGIRRTWFNDEWWYVATDIIAILTDSKDPKGYLKDMKRRDKSFSYGWGQIATLLPIMTAGGIQKLNCVSTKGAFRLVQSIPSKKSEPFKQWLAHVGYERVQEIEDPELAQNRVKEYYELKGYPKEWIDKRLRGIAIRQELTDEWKQRDISSDKEFAILTNEISRVTFGKTIKQYKEFKGLNKQNLRDHMSDWELILTMVSEKATTDITIAKNAEGFKECKQSAKEGGQIAHNTLKEIEQKTGKSIVSEQNFLDLDKKKLKNK